MSSLLSVVGGGDVIVIGGRTSRAPTPYSAVVSDQYADPASSPRKRSIVATSPSDAYTMG